MYCMYRVYERTQVVRFTKEIFKACKVEHEWQNTIVI